MTATPASVETPPAQQRFCELLQEALADGSLLRITLGAPLRQEPGLKSLVIRPIVLKDGLRLSFVFRHATRDITKNYPHAEGLRRITDGLGTDFRTAHLTTTRHTAQLQYLAGRAPQLTLSQPRQQHRVSLAHDRVKRHPLAPASAPWLHDLGVTAPDGAVLKGMEGKFRQIQKFVELLQHWLPAAQLLTPSGSHAGGASAKTPLTMVDMGCGKGYLTFAAYEWLQRNAGPFDKLKAGLPVEVLGVDDRAELVELCNQAARKHQLNGLRFQVGKIAEVPLGRLDILLALHACDTATDDALAHGIRAEASLIIVAPCCHKELRPQISPPAVLRGALRHGILLEREAEFVTDALRAALLEWAGYETRVFEFIATEHTSKNLMIVGSKRRPRAAPEELASRVRELAQFYGVKSQRLAQQLGLALDGRA
jgi:SAM-dependent methyltransferase